MKPRTRSFEKGLAIGFSKGLATALALAAGMPALAQTALKASREPGFALRDAPPAAESPWLGGVYVAPRGGQGFNLARPNAWSAPGRSLFDTLPAAPQLEPRAAGAGQEAAAFVGYRLDSWTFNSGIRQSLDASARGATRLDLGATYGFRITERNLLTVGGGLTLGGTRVPGLSYDALTMPSAAAGWTPRAGEPGAGLRLSWLYSLDRNLYLSTTLGYDRYHAEDGAFGLDRGATSFGTVFGYRFY